MLSAIKTAGWWFIFLLAVIPLSVLYVVSETSCAATIAARWVTNKLKLR